MRKTGRYKIFDLLIHFFNRKHVRRIDTEFYPDPISSRHKDEFPARFRGMLFNDIHECTGCGECVRVCPTQCIELGTIQMPKSKKLWVEKYDIDFSACLFCARCVEVCEPRSLQHTKEIQPAFTQHQQLKYHFGKGKP